MFDEKHVSSTRPCICDSLYSLAGGAHKVEHPREHNMRAARSQDDYELKARDVHAYLKYYSEMRLYSPHSSSSQLCQVLHLILKTGEVTAPGDR